MDRTSRSMLNKSDESEHSCLLPDLKGNILNFFPVEYDVGCSFVVYGFYHVDVFSLYAHLAECFVINGCCISSNAFSISIDMIMCFVPFISFMWCIMFIDLQIRCNPCFPGMNSS